MTYGNADQVAYLSSRSQFLIERAFTLKGGWDPIKIQLQFGSSKNITTPDFLMRNGFLTLGMVYDLRRDQSGGVKIK